MAVFKINHATEYTVISNKMLRDNRLSLKTIGLFSKILSLPENWDLSEQGLAAICKDGVTAVNSALKELESNGYLERGPIRSEGKIVDWYYNFYEDPKDVELGSLDLENLGLESTDNKVNNNKVNI